MIRNKKVLAITLARGGSTRIPKKNIIDVNGKPLIQYTIDEVIKSKYIDNYFVSTEDKQIADVVKKFNVGVHNRPAELAKNTTTSAESLMEAVSKVGLGYDYLVEIMATNPLKTVKDIDGVIEKLYETKADSVVSVVRIWDHHPSRVKYIENDRLIDFYPEIPESRRQDLTPAAYVRNGSIYATTVKSFIKNKVRLGPDTRPYIMSEDDTINIDEPRDLELARVIMK
jgi:CMP-N,N'-diacetyllegionaminic acid synthase